MPQVPKPVRKARAARLREAGARALARYLEVRRREARRGETLEVLIEKRREGRSQHYAEVRLGWGDYAPGDLVKATVTGVDDGVLIADPWV